MTTQDDPRAELLGLARDLRAHLQYQAAAAATVPEADAPALPSAPQASAGGGAGESLDEIRRDLGECTRCDLAEHRTKLVFGAGSERARIVFVGEAPGADEDRSGVPFVGKAGRMLTDMITNVLRTERGKVYICNVLKCRPPGNRNPLPTEVMTCTPYLERQLASIRPLVIVALGRFAAQHLLHSDAPVGRLRGRVHELGDARLIVTYHPAYLLRNPEEKRKAMDDLMLIRATLEECTGEPLPPVIRGRRRA